MSKHHLSNATTLSYGEGYYGPGYSALGHQGAPITPVAKISLGSPAAAASGAICAAQAVSGAGDLTLATTLGVTLDVPRGVSVVSSASGDSTQTLRITGRDAYGASLVEDIALTGATPAPGKKAFKIVTKVTASAAASGNLAVGTNDKLGLPVRLKALADHLRVFFNDTVDASATVVKGDATTATATTGDVRGTVDPNSACNGSPVAIWLAADPTSKDTLFGVDQYGG